MAYRKTTKQLEGEISLDGEQLRLLMVIDEKKSMDRLASDAGFDKPTLRKSLARLLESGLIEHVEGAGGPFLDRNFLNNLKISLARALGPMAEFLIEDAAADLNLTVDKIPVSRVAELITALALEIPDKKASDTFKKNIIPLIPK